MSNQPLAIVLANFKSKWNPGLDVCHAHKSGGKDRIYLMNSTTGKAQSRNIRGTRRISSTANWKKEFGAGTDSLICFDVGGNSFFMHGSSSNGKVKIYPIIEKGELGDPVYQNTWSAGWDSFQTYTLDGKLFLVLIKSGTGDIHIHEMDTDGKVGSKTFDSNVGENWKIARTYSVGSKVFLFLLNPVNGHVEIHEMNASGEIEKEVKTYDWSSGWDVANFYTVGSKVFLFLLKSSSGQVHIQEMNSDGTVGLRKFTSDWSSGWDSATFYSSGSSVCLSLVKSSNGQGHLHEMEADGSVGKRINPKEPFTKEHIEQQLTVKGNGKGLLFDYFEDISRGRVGLIPSFVTDWLTIQDSWENVKTKSRSGKVDVARKLAEQKGYSINSTQSVIAIHSQPGDSGAAGRYVLAHPHGQSLEFFAHEVLHTWGLGHSFSDDPSVPDSWGNALSWAVYDNPWDIMSAMRSYGHDNGLNSSVGPGLNIFGLEQMGWLNDQTVIDVNANSSPQDITIKSLSVRLNRDDIGIRIPYSPGEFYTVEYRTKDQWDKGIPSDTALIHRVEASLTPRDTSWKGNLGKGWDVFNVFRVNGNSFLFGLKSSNGIVQIHKIEPNGKLGSKVYQSDWSSGWTTAESYEIGAETYLFLLKESTGDVHIHKMNNDGSLGTKISDLRWSSGWTTAKHYVVDGKPYLFLLKESNGHVHIHKLEQNGKVGEEVIRYDWSSGWTDAQFYYQKEDCFVALYKRGVGTVHTHKMNDNGSVGSRIDTTSWEKGWDTIHAYGKHSTQLIRFNSKTGDAHFQSTNENGSLVDVPKEAKYSWTDGWTAGVGFSTEAGLYMFIYKTESGRAELVLMSKARVLRKRKAVDSSRSAIQEIDENGVKIKVMSTNASTRRAVIRVGG